MALKNVVIHIGAARRKNAHGEVSGTLRVCSIKEVVQATSYFNTALGLQSEEAQHFFTREEARSAVVRHKRVYFADD